LYKKTIQVSSANGKCQLWQSATFTCLELWTETHRSDRLFAEHASSWLWHMMLASLLSEHNCLLETVAYNFIFVFRRAVQFVLLN